MSVPISYKGSIEQMVRVELTYFDEMVFKSEIHSQKRSKINK